VKETLDDASRSVEYKASRIAKIYDEETQAAQELLDTEADRLEVALRSARREINQPVLKGAKDPATLWLAYWAALDKAKKITTISDLRNALQESEMLGDDLMSKALMTRAVELGDGKSLETYLAPRPEEKVAYDRYVEAAENWNEWERQSIFHGLSRFKRPEEWGLQNRA
jgi:hypothetical protein